MIKEIFKKKKYGTVRMNKNISCETNIYNSHFKENKKEKYEDIEYSPWIKCRNCGEAFLREEIENNYHVCVKCNFHFRIGARERIDLLLDRNSFIEYDKEMESTNPLNFPDYNDKIKAAKDKSGEKDAVVSGEGRVNGIPIIICVMDSGFMMGSMGSVVGEKITRAIEKAIEKRLPIIIFSASGGARMQEGILSLMQMAKTSAAVSKLSNEGLVYISVLTDPTTGGVTASFAMLGDIILAEPNALIGFAGPRVIEQTIRQKLPKGFQKSEFLKEKGFVDKIVNRKDLKEMLYQILYIHTLGGEKNE